VATGVCVGNGVFLLCSCHMGWPDGWASCVWYVCTYIGERGTLGVCSPRRGAFVHIALGDVLIFYLSLFLCGFFLGISPCVHVCLFGPSGSDLPCRNGVSWLVFGSRPPSVTGDERFITLNYSKQLYTSIVPRLIIP